MRPAIRCSSCVHAVLTGILPNGVLEYACCKSNDLTPYFYYSANPERVDDCIDYMPIRKHVDELSTDEIDSDISFYESV